jgi:hypothetical protein
MCIRPYVSGKKGSHPLILDGHHKCTFGVDITIPETNLAKQIVVEFVFHSATKKQFGEPIYIKITVDQSKKMVSDFWQGVRVD